MHNLHPSDAFNVLAVVVENDLIMATVLISAIGATPDKSSLAGLWTIIQEVAKHDHVIVATHTRNQAAIELYQEEHSDQNSYPIRFTYFNTPLPFRLLNNTFFWQLFLPFRIKQQPIAFDVVYHLCFSQKNATNFLWLLKKPLLVGPLKYEPKIPIRQLFKAGVGKWIGNNFGRIAQKLVRKYNPFLAYSLFKADTVLMANDYLKLSPSPLKNKMVLLPPALEQLHFHLKEHSQMAGAFVHKMIAIAAKKRIWVDQLPEKQKQMHQIETYRQFGEILADVA